MKKLLTIFAGVGLFIPAFASQALAKAADWKIALPTTSFALGGASLGSVISSVIEWLLILSAVLAVFWAIMGGYQYITAGGDAEKASGGRTTLLNAVIGLIIIFAAYAVVKFVLKFVLEATP